jgi:CheY-like chemotaxis protein
VPNVHEYTFVKTTEDRSALCLRALVRSRRRGRTPDSVVGKLLAGPSTLPGNRPGYIAGDVCLSRRHKGWDSFLGMLAAPFRSRISRKRFGHATQLRSRTALGRSHSVSSSVFSVAEQWARAVLVVDDFNPFSKLIREMLARRGFAVFGAKSPDEGLALFQAHQPEIDLAVIDLVSTAAGNLDLAAELERLRPGLPVLYLVGEDKTIARCSIEAQAPDAVLAVPFTEEQLIAHVGGLLDVEVASRQRPGERLWEQLIA